MKELGLTYSANGPFTKQKERIQKFKATGDSCYIYQNELDKAYFQQIMANDKIEREKKLQIKYYILSHLKLLVIQDMMDIKEDLLLWFINLLIENLMVKE